MKRRKPLQTWIETALTRLGFLVLPPLPRSAIVRLSRLFGWIGYTFSPRLRRVGMTNLTIAFKDDKSIEEKKQILKASYRSFALVLLDAFWFSRKTEQRIASWVRFNPCYDPLFEPRAHICVTAHYGNWEVLGMAVTSRGFPLHSVAKPLKNPAVDAMFIEARRKNGQSIVKREGAVRTLLRILQQQGKIALVLDQNTKLSEGGQFFTFFGLPVPVSTAPAGLAIKTRADIFLGMLTPQSDGTYLGDFAMEIPVEPYRNMTPDVAVAKLTQRITEEFEALLRRQPEFWLWTYKRWKYVPQGDDPKRFPYYRRPAV